jgi:tRNA-Thr(GGU) m(6)t(6)A37 methyltransferase TsaA
MSTITIHPVGMVHNDIETPTDDNWHKVISEIHINTDLQDGLQGLSDWSHVVVIFSMHETQFDPQQHLIRRPREREDMPRLGIFAQRARHHPNTIGITAVRLLGIDGAIVRVKGLDAINGTPVLDIKPYAPVYDGVTEPLVPAWFVRLMQ